MRRLVILSAIALLLVAVGVISQMFTIRSSPKQAGLDFISLPEGFSITVFAQDLGGSVFSTPGVNPGPRLMTLRGSEVLVSTPSMGAVLALEDTNSDGVADKQRVVIDNLNKPHGLATHQNWLYIAEEHQVIRIQNNDVSTKEVLTPLPAGAGHSTRTIRIIDEKLYVSVGSSCNVCVKSEPERAALLECSLEGKNCHVFARGLRNTVDFIEYNGVIYGTENGRDRIGNDIPPDEINIIEAGNDYGWPYCYGNNIQDLDFDPSKIKRCTDTTAPFVELQAHSAPLGLTAYTGDAFPAEYRGDLFVAYHGSWNRQPPTGYKIVHIDIDSREVSDFATGWFEGDVVKGRPVGIINYQNGLLVSDDNAGKIYLIQYK